MQVILMWGVLGVVKDTAKAVVICLIVIFDKIPMYTKQEISKQKQAFWTAFGRDMKPVASADDGGQSTQK